MVLTRHEILNLVLRELSAKQTRECSVYLDSRMKEPGDEVRVGLKTMDMPFLGFLVFVDLMPMANWGHPVVYLLIKSDGTDLVRVDDQFPPFEGDSPEHFQVLSRSGRQLTIAPKEYEGEDTAY